MLDIPPQMKRNASSRSIGDMCGDSFAIFLHRILVDRQPRLATQVTLDQTRAPESVVSQFGSCSNPYWHTRELVSKHACVSPWLAWTTFHLASGNVQIIGYEQSAMTDEVLHHEDCKRALPLACGQAMSTALNM